MKPLVTGSLNPLDHFSLERKITSVKKRNDAVPKELIAEGRVQSQVGAVDL